MQRRCWSLLLVAWQIDAVLSNANLIILQAVRDVREGETVSLGCLSSRQQDDHVLTWGYVPVGTTNIKWILSMSPGSTDIVQHPGFEPRFSATNDSDLTLTIERVKMEDSRRFYCQSKDTVVKTNEWCGCAVILNVKPAITPRPPSVELLQPSSEEVSLQADCKLVCVVSEFYPDTVSVSWYVGSTQLSSGVSNSGILMESEDSYTMISELTVPTHHWLHGLHYTCLVSDKTLSSPIRKVISKDDLIPPSVYVLPPTSEEIGVKKTATSVCLAVGFYPKDIVFSWLVNNHNTTFRSKTLPPALNTNGSYSSRSELTVAVHEWESGSLFTCQIQHVLLSTPVRHSLRKINDGYIQEPVIQLISPQSDIVSAGQNVTLTCLVSDFYPAAVSVTWRDENGPVDTGVTQFAVALGSTGTYRTVSQLTVPTAEWESNHPYWCEVNHVSLGQTLQRVVTKDLGISSGTPGIMTPLRIVTVVGGLLLIITAVTITYKITTSSSSTETENYKEWQIKTEHLLRECDFSYEEKICIGTVEHDLQHDLAWKLIRSK
ncbi:hypothetical protein chiPu_0010575 [Chiloscyllium punctatum]|uniref:Ig-like domain-containing protein n=1 Tax=Chiloscyllium punctatum TaxID=137246 RepID=A0A401SNY4_CHIPU|nr:hypothetical protein [Chiloscyllium punctatum]